MNRFINTEPQSRRGSSRWLIVCILCVLCATVFHHPARAQGVTFLATWQNAYFRSAPSVNAPTLAPLVQGTSFSVVGRTEDQQWLALSVPNFTGWLPAGFGEVTGDLSLVPAVKQELPAVSKNTNVQTLPGWIKPGPRAKALYQQAMKSGRDGRVFTIAGDSNSTWQRNIGRIAAGPFPSMESPNCAVSWRASIPRLRG